MNLQQLKEQLNNRSMVKFKGKEIEHRDNGDGTMTVIEDGEVILTVNYEGQRHIKIGSRGHEYSNNQRLKMVDYIRAKYKETKEG